MRHCKTKVQILWLRFRL